jgi:hypothetical protein
MALAVLALPLGAMHPLAPEPVTSCNVKAKDPLRIAVLLWGAVRNLTNTIDSLDQNLYTPLRKLGSVDTFVHFLDVSRITNTHFDESGVVLPPAEEEAQRLSPCRFVVEEQQTVDDEFNIEEAAKATMHRSRKSLSLFNDLPTVMNIHRSRLSLYTAGLMVRQYQKLAGFQYHIVAAVRPDTLLLSPLPAVVPAILLSEPQTIFVPAYAHGHALNGGVNDRFAMGGSDQMLDVYVRQWDQQFIPGMFEMTDSEGTLCQHLAHQNVTLRSVAICLVRVRAGGETLRNDYIDERTRPQCKGANVVPYTGDLKQTCPDPPRSAIISSKVGPRHAKHGPHAGLDVALVAGEEGAAAADAATDAATDTTAGADAEGRRDPEVAITRLRQGV